MKKFFYLLCAATAIVSVSCQKEAEIVNEEIQEQESNEPEQTLVNPVTLTFSANASTKVSISGEGTGGEKTAVWEENDQVKVVWYNTSEEKMKSATATVDTFGDIGTTFSATVEEAEFYYAVYPSTLTVTLDGESNFTVNFPNNSNASTSFGGAAWYAAKTTFSDKCFAFHPISTIIRFKLDGTAVTSPEKVYFRSVTGGLHKLHGHAAITFANETGYPVSASSTDGAANVAFKVNGAGEYYIPLPGYGASENTGTDGFIFQIQKAGERIPAAYYSATISQQPGKLYNIKNALDGKVITDYYVARTTQGSGGGLSEANAETLANLKANVPAFKYNTYIAGAMLLDGVTIHILGDETAYTEPIGALNTNNSAHAYTIVGGTGGGTTTFTTTSAATFGASKAIVTVQDITFSGCTSASAVNISAGDIRFTGCVFSYNTAANGAAITIGSTSASDSNLKVSFTNTQFTNNTASTGNGGAIFVAEGSTGGIVSFNNCLFDTNKATANGKSGGVAYENNGSTALLFNNCSFTGNDAKSNGILIYLNSANGRLGMNNCTINGGSTYSKSGETYNDNKKQNGALITNKGKSVIANSTLWSKDGYGAWGLIALGSSGLNNGSSVVNCLVRNGVSTVNTNNYAAFACNANYYQNVQWCVYTGANGVGSSPNNVVSAEKHTFENCWNLGVALGETITGANYKSQTINGIKQYYYTWTNDLAEAGFTKPTSDQIRNVIAKTAESAEDQKDGFGKLFLDWLDEVNGLEADIVGAARPAGGFKPGSVE